MNLPNDVRFILDNLTENGFEAYVVGGCVRDSIMGKTPKDWDITTNALPEEVKSVFKKTIDTGIKHGTVTVLKGGNAYEITTYRVDGKYLDGRHPEEVFFTPNLEEDLLRRDFTMNSIAYHYKTGFVDPFGGVDDIKKKSIKGVGDPDKRFQEDALRMMRAIRFSAQLSFDIEQKTYDAIHNNANLIEKISMERIRDEFSKIILSEEPEKFSIVLQSNLWVYIHKESLHYLENKFTDVISYISISDKDLKYRLSLLFLHFEKEELIRFLKYFRFDNDTIKFVGIYNEWAKKELSATRYDVSKYLNILTLNHFESILYIRNVIAKIDCDSRETELLCNISNLKMEIIKNGNCYKISDLQINGDILQKMGIPKGRQIGEILNYLLDEVIKEPSKNNELILKELVEKEI